MMKSPLPLKKRVVLSSTSDETMFYQYRREKEEKLEEDEDKENRPKHIMGSNKEGEEEGEWDGEEEEKSSPRSWDFRNRSALAEAVQ